MGWVGDWCVRYGWIGVRREKVRGVYEKFINGPVTTTAMRYDEPRHHVTLCHWTVTVTTVTVTSSSRFEVKGTGGPRRRRPGIVRNP